MDVRVVEDVKWCSVYIYIMDIVERGRGGGEMRGKTRRQENASESLI